MGIHFPSEQEPLTHLTLLGIGHGPTTVIFEIIPWSPQLTCTEEGLKHCIFAIPTTIEDSGSRATPKVKWLEARGAQNHFACLAPSIPRAQASDP